MATEQDLQEYAQSNVISAFKIVENQDGKYNLQFTVTWKKEDSVLSSARKDLRQWTSLNTLVKFITALGVPDVPITIHPLRHPPRPKGRGGCQK